MLFKGKIQETLEFLGVVNDNMDAHLHFGLLEGEIETRDLCILNLLGHLLRGDRTVKGVPIDQLGLLGALAVRFQNINRLDRVSFNSLK